MIDSMYTQRPIMIDLAKLACPLRVRRKFFNSQKSVGLETELGSWKPGRVIFIPKKIFRIS